MSQRRKPTVTSCPRCGGTSGFEFCIRLKMIGFWGESAESSDVVMSDNTKVTCLDCGALVSRRLAERERG